MPTMSRIGWRTVLLYKVSFSCKVTLFSKKRLDSRKTRLVCKHLYDKGPKLLPSKSKPGRTAQVPAEGNHLWWKAAHWDRSNHRRENRPLQSGSTPITTSPEALAEPQLNWRNQSDPWPDPWHPAVTCFCFLQNLQVSLSPWKQT